MRFLALVLEMMVAEREMGSSTPLAEVVTAEKEVESSIPVLRLPRR